ncbi:Alpha-galactosidase A precursor [Aquisphaera giovannonii]|uniref:Alpha-galactosidase n=1 Tax=Aquisphaera giovannonii TaxID=406548 RepID=A0A5B9W3G9_9BACT|nr:NPCBM/NEW2 domain-containing protein [Aquisphaera giovannonii]QEH34490.1 Alpha-galactosidase A precursor [Aquisphaera giovannonii]
MKRGRPRSSVLAFPCLLAPFLVLAAAAAADEYRVSALDLSGVTQGWGSPGKDKSVDGRTLTIAGRHFEHGVGTHADSRLAVDLKGSASRLHAWVGVDDEVTGEGSVEFRVVADGKLRWSSGVMRTHQAAKEVDVDLSNARKLILQVADAGDGINYDHADWADATITFEGAKPELLVFHEATYILTPKPSPAPRINGAKVVGVRPGSPFLFTVAATGRKPIAFAAEGLPEGLSLDPATGFITGRTEAKGEHRVRVSATNALGKATRELRIVVGDRLALTPPLGWNSWNCFAGAVTEKNVRDATDAFVNAGLRDHGWTYINIDDFWMTKNDDRDRTLHGPERDASGRINSNPRFPDMKALSDYIHSRGLKAGLYSSPGPTTCGGCLASYKHEKEDAERFAEWGFDYLKYDWCSYGNVEHGTGRAYYAKPYDLMGRMLRAQPRDIVFSLCQYGMDNVWEWGDQVGGNCWRTTGDITDSWGSMSGIGFKQDGHEKYAGPGHWNDPDMLVVGWVGWGPALHPTHLTPSEQYTHITLWSLLSSPLLIGCDLTRLDDFTLNLLTNDEVLDVNQDPLGRPARRVVKREDETEVWARPLEDGSIAVGLFNLGEEEATATVTWAEIEAKAPKAVRDLWRQRDVEVDSNGYTVKLPRHGAALIKVTPGA